MKTGKTVRCFIARNGQTLTAFASNKRAIRVYEKVGFVQTGTVPKKHFKEGKYIDEVIMTKLLE